jgi:ABC-type multidrug transport system permease subunit
MFKGFGAIFYKEMLQISRDPLTLLLMLIQPMGQMLFFGYAINTDIRNITTAVYDLDQRREARELIDAFENSDCFHITAYVRSDEELNRAIVSGQANIGIKIPPDYSERLAAGRQATVLVLINGSDPSVAALSLSVSTSIGLSQSLGRLTGSLAGGAAFDRSESAGQLPVEVRPKMLFNPDARSANFMVPGLVAIILQALTILLTAFSIVRERERGTLDQLLVTPIRPSGLMLGKLAPYGLIGFCELCLVLTFMRVVFEVPIHGSLALLLLLSTLFLFANLSIGLLVSASARNQVQAFQFAWIFILPSVMLSGYMFPRASMPPVMQTVGEFLPATHYIGIIRGIVLRGATLADLLPEVTILAVIGLALFVLSTLRFHKHLA